MGWLQRLSDGLTKTRDIVRGSLDRLLGRAADPALLEEFEAALIASDLGAVRYTGWRQGRCAARERRKRQRVQIHRPSHSSRGAGRRT